MGRIPRVFGFDVEKGGARQKVGTPSTISPSLRLGALGALPALPRGRKRCAIGRQESLSVRRLVVFLLLAASKGLPEGYTRTIRTSLTKKVHT